MKKHIFIFILFFFSSQSSVLAQFELPSFGSFSYDELSVAECPFDREAEAVVLRDYAFSHYDDDYQLITERAIRIKILNQRGIDRGNIRIRFYNKNKFETISKIQALSYNQDGGKVISEIDRKSIFTEKEDDIFSSIKFAIPNVKTGSIIEYRYISTMKHYGGLDNWAFQSDIPALKSCYLLEVLPNSEFSYVFQKKTNYPAIVKSLDGGRIYFEMNNIPGLRLEPYMDAPQDYMQKVNFQFSGYINSFGDQKKVNTTWKELSISLATEEDLGGTLRKNIPANDDLSTLVVAESTALGKIKAIYSYVKNNFTWNGYYGKYASDGLKKIIASRTGSAGEINLLFINLLRTYKIEAVPLLVAERDFGKVNLAAPFENWFNKTVAYVEADGNNFVIDATQKYCPAEITPYPLLNTYALIINKKTDKPVLISGSGRAFQNQVKLKGSFTKDGLLKGSCIVNSYDYAKGELIEKITKDKQKFISSTYEESYEGLKVNRFEYDYPKQDSSPLVQHVEFMSQLSETGGFVLYNYNLFTGLRKNIFKADERFTNINFGYPVDITVEEEIELPPGSRTDELPKDKTQQTADKKISLSREIKRTGDILSIKISFKQSITLVAADSYPALKNFYKLMVDMLNEPVVIRF